MPFYEIGIVMWLIAWPIILVYYRIQYQRKLLPTASIMHDIMHDMMAFPILIVPATIFWVWSALLWPVFLASGLVAICAYYLIKRNA
jgi:hypothetical protein